MSDKQFGPGRPAGATSQPWGPYVADEDGYIRTNPNASQPISPTEPQEREFFFKEEESEE